MCICIEWSDRTAQNMKYEPHQFNQHQYQDLLLRNTDIYASAKYEDMVASFRGVPSMRILNVGCGSGELSFLLAAEGHTVSA
jgi:2-polyprenyl-3-methyl-5-hydroxy-6-metoxy-1,4-benzoquinol methylase